MGQQREMFPDCRSPQPCRLQVSVYEPPDLEHTTLLTVMVYDDRRNCLASSTTSWMGSEHDHLPKTIAAAFGLWAMTEDPKHLVALVEQHYKDAMRLVRGGYA